MNKIKKLITFVILFIPLLLLGQTSGILNPREKSSDEVFRYDEKTATASSIFFPEVLVCRYQGAAEAERSAVENLVKNYSSLGTREGVKSIQDFAKQNPDCSWNPSLLLNAGMVAYRTGYFSVALSCYQEAWALGEDDTDGTCKLIADRAVGELASLRAKLGHREELQSLLESIKERDVRGPGTELVRGAIEGGMGMRLAPEEAYRCGPLALEIVGMKMKWGEVEGREKLAFAKSTDRGTSLQQISEWAEKVGLDLQPAYRESSEAEILTPCVIHWEVGHFAALTEKKGNHVLSVDHTFDFKRWISDGAINEEGSGYFLVPAGDLPDGWRKTTLEEQSNIWGCGNPAVTKSSDSDPENDPLAKSNQCQKGMPVYNFVPSVCGLLLKDTPIWHYPPIGPAVECKFTYNHRNSIGSYVGQFGSKWSFDLLGSARVSGQRTHSSNPEVVRHTHGLINLAIDLDLVGGHRKSFLLPSTIEAISQASVPPALINVRVITFPISRGGEVILDIDFQTNGFGGGDWILKVTHVSLDGSRQIFRDLIIGSGLSGSEVFTQAPIVEKTDSVGNKLTFEYLGDLLSKVINAIGGETTFTHADITLDGGGVVQLVNTITGPYGRQAHIEYNGARQLTSITGHGWTQDELCIR